MSHRSGIWNSRELNDSKTLLSLTPVIERLESEVKKLKGQVSLYKKLYEKCQKELKIEQKNYRAVITQKKFSPKTSYKELQQELMKK